MNYITIEAKTYEQAVEKARSLYGDKLRIHSRRDRQERGFLGLGVRQSCEITCFISSETPVRKNDEKKEEDILIRNFEQEAITPDPRKKSSVAAPAEEKTEAVSETLVAHVEGILKKNDFSDSYCRRIVSDIRKQLQKAYPSVPDKKEIEVALFDLIIGSVEFDYSAQIKPSAPLVMLGPEYSGKTTCLAKTAALYAIGRNAEKRKRCVMITLSNANGAAERLAKIGAALDVETLQCDNARNFAGILSTYDENSVVLIDTDGVKPKDPAPDAGTDLFFREAGYEKFMFCLIVPATMKYSDAEALVKLFGKYRISSVIATMTDMSLTIGNVISLCSDRKIPVLFFTDGKRIPQDIKRASASFIAGNLKGFSIDLSGLLRGAN